MVCKAVSTAAIGFPPRFFISTGPNRETGDFIFDRLFFACTEPPRSLPALHPRERSSGGANSEFDSQPESPYSKNGRLSLTYPWLLSNHACHGSDERPRECVNQELDIRWWLHG